MGCCRARGAGPPPRSWVPPWQTHMLLGPIGALGTAYGLLGTARQVLPSPPGVVWLLWADSPMPPRSWMYLVLLNYKVQFKENKLFLGIIITRYVVRKQLKKTPRQLEESHIPALGWPLRCEGVHSPGSQEAHGPRAWGPPGTPCACKGELRLCCLACNSEQAVNPQVEPSLLLGTSLGGEAHQRAGLDPALPQPCQEALNPCEEVCISCPLENATARKRLCSSQVVTAPLPFCLP